MSDRISKLVHNFETHIGLPWQKVISSEERAIFVIYNKEDELKLRARVAAFEEASVKHGHPWLLLDITTRFAQWLANEDYKEAYFEDPDYLTSSYEHFAEELAAHLVEQASAHQHENNTVALLGAGTLFGITSVSGLVKALGEKLQGRLVVFFPGEKIDNVYRLLDAKDGWGYQATTITVSE
jgi:hypothetical protein